MVFSRLLLMVVMMMMMTMTMVMSFVIISCMMMMMMLLVVNMRLVGRRLLFHTQIDSTSNSHALIHRAASENIRVRFSLTTLTSLQYDIDSPTERRDVDHDGKLLENIARVITHIVTQ